MKSMQPPLAVIFLMIYFYRAGGHAPPPLPPTGCAIADSLLYLTLRIWHFSKSTAADPRVSNMGLCSSPDYVNT